MRRSIVGGMPAEKIALAQLPPTALAVAARLARAGGRTYLVGGPVRDLLLGLPILDCDLATDLAPAAVAAALPEADARDAALGAFRLGAPGGEAVVTSLRAEGDYRDSRHPSRVEFVTDVAVDARRRDFTVNALYVDLGDGSLVDPLGGRSDLAARRLCAIGDPAQRFAEDPLRLLRAMRFAARLQFELAPATAAAARSEAPRLLRLSAERAFNELTAAFTGAGRGRALQQMVDLGFAAVLLPEVAAMAGVPQPPEYHPEGCVLTHTCLVLEQVPAGDPVLAWSAVLHDIGKPPTFRVATDRIRFDGHDTLSATMADAVLRRFHASTALRTAVVAICRDHIRFAALPAMRPRRRERWMRQPDFPQHLAFHRADCLGSHGRLSLYETALAQWRALPPEPPVLVTGADVLALGVAEGPLVGELLTAVDAALADVDAPDRPMALAVLNKLAAQRIKAQ
jgi:poly(A) polymerase